MEIQTEHMDSGTTSSTQLDGVCISTKRQDAYDLYDLRGLARKAENG